MAEVRRTRQSVTLTTLLPTTPLCSSLFISGFRRDDEKIIKSSFPKDFAILYQQFVTVESISRRASRLLLETFNSNWGGQLTSFCMVYSQPGTNICGATITAVNFPKHYSAQGWKNRILGYMGGG